MTSLTQDVRYLTVPQILRKIRDCYHQVKFTLADQIVHEITGAHFLTKKTSDQALEDEASPLRKMAANDVQQRSYPYNLAVLSVVANVANQFSVMMRAYECNFLNDDKYYRCFLYTEFDVYELIMNLCQRGYETFHMKLAERTLLWEIARRCESERNTAGIRTQYEYRMRLRDLLVALCHTDGDGITTHYVRSHGQPKGFTETFYNNPRPDSFAAFHMLHRLLLRAPLEGPRNNEAPNAIQFLNDVWQMEQLIPAAAGGDIDDRIYRHARVTLSLVGNQGDILEALIARRRLVEHLGRILQKLPDEECAKTSQVRDLWYICWLNACRWITRERELIVAARHGVTQPGINEAKLRMLVRHVAGRFLSDCSDVWSAENTLEAAFKTRDDLKQQRELEF